MNDLSVHRNTLEKRRKKERKNDARAALNGIFSKDIRAYAILAIDAEGKFYASWDTGDIMPLWSFAPTMIEGLRRSVEESGVEDGWKPDLKADGRPNVE